MRLVLSSASRGSSGLDEEKKKTKLVSPYRKGQEPDGGIISAHKREMITHGNPAPKAGQFVERHVDNHQGGKKDFRLRRRRRAGCPSI